MLYYVQRDVQAKIWHNCKWKLSNSFLLWPLPLIITVVIEIIAKQTHHCDLVKCATTKGGSKQKVPHKNYKSRCPLNIFQEKHLNWIILFLFVCLYFLWLSSSAVWLPAMSVWIFGYPLRAHNYSNEASNCCSDRRCCRHTSNPGWSFSIFGLETGSRYQVEPLLEAHRSLRDNLSANGWWRQ